MSIIPKLPTPGTARRHGVDAIQECPHISPISNHNLKENFIHEMKKLLNTSIVSYSNMNENNRNQLIREFGEYLGEIKKNGDLLNQASNDIKGWRIFYNLYIDNPRSLFEALLMTNRNDDAEQINNEISKIVKETNEELKSEKSSPVQMMKKLLEKITRRLWLGNQDNKLKNQVLSLFIILATKIHRKNLHENAQTHIKGWQTNFDKYSSFENPERFFENIYFLNPSR